MVAAGSAVSAVGVESYLDSRHAAQAAFAELNAQSASVQGTVDTLSSQATALIATAQAALAEADGKTLDATAQDAVRAAIAVLQSSIPELQTEADALVQESADVQAKFSGELLWPPQATALVESVDDELGTAVYDTATDSLNLALNQLTAARAAWQAERPHCG